MQSSIAKNKEKKDRNEKICEYCGKPLIVKKDGGKVTIPTSVSNLPPADIFLHNSCLNSYIKKCERNKPKLVMHFA